MLTAVTDNALASVGPGNRMGEGDSETLQNEGR